MKRDVYIFGQHISRPSVACRLAFDSIISISTECQLATTGFTGDDEFREVDPAPIVVTNHPQYGYINPYTVGFFVV